MNHRTAFVSKAKARGYDEGGIAHRFLRSLLFAIHLDTDRLDDEDFCLGGGACRGLQNNILVRLKS